MRAVRRTWTIGGIGLVLSGVVGMLLYAVPFSGLVVVITIDVLFAAAVLFFAIGLSTRASVVARRPLGVTALVIVAVWPLILHVAQPFLPAMDAATFDAGLEAYRAAESVLTTVFVVDLVVSFGAALVAAVQIARAGIVPGPWRWAPMWALLASIAGGVLPQVLFVSLGPADAQNVVGVAAVLGALGFLARTLGLGIVALILASRVGGRDVEVFHGRGDRIGPR